MSLTRRVSGIQISDSAKTVGYVFGYRNMPKATILDPNAKKTDVLGSFSSIRNFVFFLAIKSNIAAFSIFLCPKTYPTVSA